MSAKTDILIEITDERTRQDAKWGGPEHDDTHADVHWASFVQARCWSGSTRKELIEAAALIVAWIESLDRRNAVASGAVLKEGE